jgi:hypothetical protein
MMVTEYAQEIVAFVTSHYWIALALGWAISIYVTYKIGRRQNVDNIHIKKRNEFSEQIAALLKEDYDDRKSLRQDYKANFSQYGSLDEVIAAFGKFDTLYAPIKRKLATLPDRLPKIRNLNDKATLYFDDKTSACIDDYLKETSFTYVTDEMGLISDYGVRLFEKLLNESDFAKLSNAHEKAIKRLRRLVG